MDEKVKATVHTWAQWIEPWYLAYGLLGVTAAGIVPILLPLTVNRGSNAASIGLVMAALNLGGMTAPLWGSLSDRFRLHRLLLTLGLLGTAAGLFVFPFVTSLLPWLALAFLQGVGIASASTVANLFVVEAHPKEEWDERIGWLQTLYGIGQVVGLAIASVLSQTQLTTGLVVAAGLTALGAGVGWLTARVAPNPRTPKPALVRAVRHSESVVGSPQRAFHHLGKAALRQSTQVVRSPFGRFLFIWLVTFAGSAAVFSLYPVLMQQVFGVTPAFSSTAFAISAGLGLALYSPAGRGVDRWGAKRVLVAGLSIRLLAFAGLLTVGLLGAAGQNWLALVAFAFVVMSWSLLSVSGTVLTARLSSVGEGEGMGLFNAVTALAGVAGSALGGALAGRWGYLAVPALASGSIALGALLALVSRMSQERSPAQEQPVDDPPQS
jgi:DHA1 family tetracycline resistance protein-like MFS transporter